MCLCPLGGKQPLGWDTALSPAQLSLLSPKCHLQPRLALMSPALPGPVRVVLLHAKCEPGFQVLLVAEVLLGCGAFRL